VSHQVTGCHFVPAIAQPEANDRLGRGPAADPTDSSSALCKAFHKAEEQPFDQWQAFGPNGR
jgi:hypothetical protein